MGIIVLAAYHILNTLLDFVTVKDLNIHILNSLCSLCEGPILDWLWNNRGYQGLAMTAKIYEYAYSPYNNTSPPAYPTLPLQWNMQLEREFWLPISPCSPWKLWNVSTEFYVRDARTLAAQRPGFLLIWYLIPIKSRLDKTVATCFLMALIK